MNLTEFTSIHLNLPKYKWIYLNLPELTSNYQNFTEFTKIYLNLPEFTWKYPNLHKFSSSLLWPEYGHKFGRIYHNFIFQKMIMWYMKMSVQEHIAPYLNRFVILFNQNATAKLELSCAEAKVNVNIFHELGAIEQPLPPTPPVKKAGYNEVLEKNLKISQLKRLQEGCSPGWRSQGWHFWESFARYFKSQAGNWTAKD